MHTVATRPALWIRDFILVSISNLLMFFSFYMLVPALPFYLFEDFGTSGSTAGIVLSLYTIAALFIRPFSGYLVDTFSHKPFYLVCYGIFCIIFAGYIVATTLMFFIMLRTLHGISFGLSTVSSNTLAIDIMPASRRGEGIGYFGMTTNIAMAIGPAAGLWVYRQYPFDTLFIAAFVVSFMGFLCILPVKSVGKHLTTTEEKLPLSLDRFILIKALPCVGLLLIMGIGYGIVTNYIGLYSEGAGFGNNAGIFFTIVSIGIIIARLISSRIINKGKISPMICVGTVLLATAFILFVICTNLIILYFIALLFGLGIGYMNPAFQTMLVNLAKHNQRGTANATFFTFCDLGIGIGIAGAGSIIEKLGFTWIYAICTILLVLGLIYFIFISAPYYNKNKLQ